MTFTSILSNAANSITPALTGTYNFVAALPQNTYALGGRSVQLIQANFVNNSLFRYTSIVALNLVTYKASTFAINWVLESKDPNKFNYISK